LLYFIQKKWILSVRPRIEEGEKHFFVGKHCMLKTPLYPTLVVLLSKKNFTIFDRSIFCAMRFQLELSSYLKTGTSPSLRSRDFIFNIVLDFAYFWYWSWQLCLCWVHVVRNGTKFCIDFWGDRRISIDCTESEKRYVYVGEFLDRVKIARIEVGIYSDAAEIKGFMRWRYGIIIELHWKLLIKLSVFKHWISNLIMYRLTLNQKAKIQLKNVVNNM